MAQPIELLEIGIALDNLNEILDKHGCGPIRLAGVDEATLVRLKGLVRAQVNAPASAELTVVINRTQFTTARPKRRVISLQEALNSGSVR